MQDEFTGTNLATYSRMDHRMGGTTDRDSAVRYETRLGQSGAVLWEADPLTLKYLYVSESAERLLGYPRARWYESGFREMCVHSDDVASDAAWRAWCLSDLGTHRFTYRWYAADGRDVWIDDFVTVTEEAGRGRRIHGLLVQTSPPHTHSLPTDSVCRWLMTHGDTLHLGVCECTDQGRLIRANSTFYRMVASEVGESSGCPFLEWISTADRAEFRRQWESLVAGMIANFQYCGRFGPQDAETRFLSMHFCQPRWGASGARNVVAMALDLTSHHQAAERAHQSQKMRAVEKLAGGVAHEFNNLLTIVMAASELLPLQTTLNDVGYSHVKTIQGATQRAAELTRQLLTFSRRDRAQLKLVNLNEIVVTHELRLREILGPSVDLAIDLEPDLPPIQADVKQLAQVLVHLVTNSLDAMPHGGHVLLSTRNAVVPQNHSVSPILGHVELRLRDSGSGMPTNVVERIFEPFFSTKGGAQRIGLGLAVVHGILEQHGGTIGVLSQVGLGTTMTLRFPAIPRIVPLAPKMARELPGGKETILVVDDEPDVGKIVSQILGSLGYRVFVAQGPTQAIQVTQHVGRDLDLLLTDVVMPVMNGIELASLLRMTRPRLKTIFMSGYDEAILEGQSLESATLLTKPFAPTELAHCVREAFDAKLVN